MLSLRSGSVLAPLLVAAAVAGACDDGSSGAPPATDAGGIPGPIGETVCPDVPPAAGGRCALPEGTTCAFGACGSPIARCAGGLWRYSGNPVPRPPCPKDFPVSDSLCPPCWPAGVTCTYGSVDCSAPDASANTTVASCGDGRWTVRSYPCGNLDAGADVQRDAGPDAD